MGNPTNIAQFQFALNYVAAQGDPNDPTVDWDTITWVAGVGQAGLDQAIYMHGVIQEQIENALQHPEDGVYSVRDPKVVYAPQVAWNEWELSSGTDQ